MSTKVKRPCEEVLENAKTLIFDVEGTTTSISFVKDTLFPYVRANLEAYVTKQWATKEFKEDLALLREQAAEDAAGSVEGCVAIPAEGTEAELQAAVVGNVLWQMDGDRKTKALKQLQGHVMRQGYEDGTLKGHVYADVVPALRSWAETGCQLYIYSSGSVAAQKLLFKNTEFGDLLELFQGHFDTEVGPKAEAASYTNILKQCGSQANQVIFFTDIPAEAKAAEEAGMSAVLVVRDGNTALTEEDRLTYQVIESFDSFEHGSPLKRRKVSGDTTTETCDVEMTEVGEIAPKISSIAELEAGKESKVTIEAKADKGDEMEDDVDVKIPKGKTEGEEKIKEVQVPKSGTEADIADSETSKTTETIPVESVTKDLNESTKEESQVKDDSAIDMKEPIEKVSASGEHPDSRLEEQGSEQNVMAVVPDEAVTAEVKISEETNTTPKSKDEAKKSAEVLDEGAQKSEEPVPTPEETLKMDVTEQKIEDEIPEVGNTQVAEPKPQDEIPVVSDTKVAEPKPQDEIPAVSDTKVTEPKPQDEIPVVSDTQVTEPKPQDEIPEVSDTKVTEPKPQDEIPVVSDTKVTEPKPQNTIPEVSDTKVTEPKLEDEIPVVSDTKVTEAKKIDEVEEKSEDVKVKEVCGEPLAEQKDVDKVEESASEPKQDADVQKNESTELGKESKQEESVDKDLTKEPEVAESKADVDVNGDGEKVAENGKVEEGQGDAGTLVEVSKNVENGKDSISADEIKVKKVMVDNGSDDTENAVPVTMET